MSDKTDMGGPAFPVSTRPCDNGTEFGHQDGESTWQFGGMTLWDYYAAHAPVESIGTEYSDGAISMQQGPESAAIEAAEYADAMLAERTKRTGGNS